MSKAKSIKFSELTNTSQLFDYTAVSEGRKKNIKGFKTIW